MLDLLQNAAFIALLSLGAFILSYFFYARYLSEAIFELDPNESCPAHEKEDNVDYVPADRHVLFGHHFCSITGAAPIIGPAIAVLWGWLPAVIWVVVGTIFIGAAHDFGILILSARNEGRSISDICGGIIGPKSRMLFLGLVWILIWLVIAVFAVAIGSLFVQYPASVIPVNFEIVAALLIGLTLYHLTDDLLIPSLVALLSLYGVIVLTVYGAKIPYLDLAWMANFDIAWLVPDLEKMEWMETLGFAKPGQKKVFIWVCFLLLYSFIASVIPVWVLLQPRDYINSHQVFVGLGALYIGLIIAQPKIAVPEYNSDVGHPGGVASISVNESHSQKPDRIPEGLLLIPEKEGEEETKLRRLESPEQFPETTFFTVSSIGLTGDKMPSSSQVRSTEADVGENFNGTLQPVLNSEGDPWIYHPNKKNFVPFDGASINEETSSGFWTSLRLSMSDPAQSAPPLIPFLFITIACGAISGFHGLVSSGTTSKQLSNMEDCRYIGYGGMLGEGMLGLMSVLAATAGFTLLAKHGGADVSALSMWNEHYASWGGANGLGAKIGAFVQGGGAFLGALFEGVFGDRLMRLSNAIVAIIVVSFAATTLDSATRIQRYIFTELVRPFDVDFLKNRYVASAISAFTPILLVFGGAWEMLWPLFGATNQMLAGLSMLVVTVYLYRHRRMVKNYLIPMVFLVLVTGLGLFLLFQDFFQKGFMEENGSFTHQLLSVLSICLFCVSLWIIGHGIYILLSEQQDGDREPDSQANLEDSAS